MAKTKAISIQTCLNIHYVVRDPPGVVDWGYGSPALVNFDKDGDLDYASTSREAFIGLKSHTKGNLFFEFMIPRHSDEKPKVVEKVQYDDIQSFQFGR